jgi:hypothetical protein
LSLTRRLKSQLDALGQIRQCSYTLDDRVAGVICLGAVNATPNVNFSYACISGGQAQRIAKAVRFAMGRV